MTPEQIDNLLKYCPVCQEEMEYILFVWGRMCPEHGSFIVTNVVGKTLAIRFEVSARFVAR